MTLTKGDALKIGGVAALGVAAVAVAGYFGRSTSQSTGATGLDPNVTKDVLDAAVAEHGDNTQVAIERIKDSANALVSLKTLEEQVQLGEISLEQAQAQYASQTTIAGYNATSATAIAQANARSASRIAGINASAGVTEAQAAAGAQKSGDFWSNIGGVVGTIGSTIGKLFSHI